MTSEGRSRTNALRSPPAQGSGSMLVPPEFRELLCVAHPLCGADEEDAPTCVQEVVYLIHLERGLGGLHCIMKQAAGSCPEHDALFPECVVHGQHNGPVRLAVRNSPHGLAHEQSPAFCLDKWSNLPET